jgi:dihydropteroate synthase
LSTLYLEKRIWCNFDFITLNFNLTVDIFSQETTFFYDKHLMAIQNQSRTKFLQFERIIDIALTTTAPNSTAVFKQWLDAYII